MCLDRKYNRDLLVGLNKRRLWQLIIFLCVYAHCALSLRIHARCCHSAPLLIFLLTPSASGKTVRIEKLAVHWFIWEPLHTSPTPWGLERERKAGKTREGVWGCGCSRKIMTDSKVSDSVWNELQMWTLFIFLLKIFHRFAAPKPMKELYQDRYEEI